MIFNPNLGIYHIHLSSPLGALHVGFCNFDSPNSPACSLYFAEQYQSTNQKTNQNIDQKTLAQVKKIKALWQKRIHLYFSGELTALDDLSTSLITGTEFQKSVWQTLKHIPAGQLWTYKDIAKKINKPRAARAVGGALAKNPLPIILPCHRVCRSDGSVGGYMGHSALGASRKRHLLWHEGLLKTKPQLL